MRDGYFQTAGVQNVKDSMRLLRIIRKNRLVTGGTGISLDGQRNIAPLVHQGKERKQMTTGQRRAFPNINLAFAGFQAGKGQRDRIRRSRDF